MIEFSTTEHLFIEYLCQRYIIIFHEIHENK